ncbi:hypothetical protein C3O69_04627 [Pseudomonas aeruginosa]|nr:hypothetical protein C3O69_04627 [Pseudomonas aeruginosa]
MQAVHPHTRGEHVISFGVTTYNDGSSPHPWGTLKEGAKTSRRGRFIPTPVGNTTSSAMVAPSTPVHPHTRGEHGCGFITRRVTVGSSPHPWGTLARSAATATTQRFIPTPVGNTLATFKLTRRAMVHPHTRGEHPNQRCQRRHCRGSSPHPWGTHQRAGRLPGGARFIPTPVGNTLTVSHCFKKRKTTAKFHRAKRPSRRSWK